MRTGIVTGALGSLIAMLIFGLALRLFQMSSVTGFLIGALVAAVFTGIGIFVLSNMGEDEDSFMDNWFSYRAISMFAVVTLSSFYWDEQGFCDVQLEATTVNVGPKSLEDVFKGKNRSETYVEKVSEDCMKAGAWEYTTDFGIFGLVGASLFAIPYLGMLGLGIVSISSERRTLSSSNSSSDKKVVPGIGKTGRAILLQRGSDSDYTFYMRNVDDIIKRKHLSKGDYDTWFGRAASAYLSEFSKVRGQCSPAEMITKLEWAESYIAQVYAGKSADTGEKRRQMLQKHIEALSKL